MRRGGSRVSRIPDGSNDVSSSHECAGRNELLIEMRSPSRAEQVLEDVERRFAGRGAMLVEYPVGGQTTLSEALRVLRERKWRG